MWSRVHFRQYYYTGPYDNQNLKRYTKGKRIVIKGKLVFNKKELLELIKEVEIEVSKRKSEKKRIIRATTSKVKSKIEEDIEESIHRS